ncbi:sensor histidine kinase [Vogesella sp. LIG4]|uniref:sensor histidine kinase n=1 Tax=Vogesella sp. LIG4 TaxID=1192162 RepID=UPI00081F8760|nr:sensor histidine kinase [Vogesella sp. LIG4]SCK12440.1 two-component system, OmpR family, sensor histidine kinase TctE [Vogesella sp. LIG4]
MSRSLRRQLVQWVVIPLLPLAAATAWLAQNNAREAANAAFDRTLQASARSIAERITLQDGELVVDLPVAALEMFDPHFQDRVFYRISFAGGTTVTGDSELPQPPSLPAAGEVRFYDARLRGEEIRSVALGVPLFYGGGQRLLLVQVGETTLSRQALARQLFRQSLAQQWLIGAVAALLVAVGINRALRPLQRVRAILRERAGDPSLQLEVGSVQRELQPLVSALNSALAELEQQLAVQKRFTADAAHQLRTPLTLLKTQAEVTLRMADPAEQRSGVAALVRATDQVIRLANQLLALSRAEPGPNRHDTAELDLAELARAVTLDFVTVALGKSLDLGYEGDEHAPLCGQPLLLREMLSNLVDNAVRYTPAGGEITVGAHARGDEVELTVADSGPGIAPQERALVFERFYRGQQTGGDGCGLGLAIVREIVRGHGGQIRLESASAGGLRVAITLPRQPPAR